MRQSYCLVTQPSLATPQLLLLSLQAYDDHGSIKHAETNSGAMMNMVDA